MTSGLRDRTGQELAAWLGRQGLLSPWTTRPGATTHMRYARDGMLYEPSRLRLHEELVERHRSSHPVASRQGSLTVVVTAGPPGAGNSVAMQSFKEFRGFRHIDADDFKDLLLERALDDDLLSHWTEHELCDGRPVAPRELSSYVHAESTIIANTARTEALKRGEDMIVHGTLSHEAHADDLLAELDHHQYRRLTVVDVEVPCAIACQQALDRWWSLRNQQSDPLGGRFIPPAVIRSHFEEDERVSICSRNARALSEKAAALGWEVDLRLVAPPSHPDKTHHTGRRMTPHDADPPRA